MKYRKYVNMDSFTDPRDEKIYKTVKIGNQVWMAENLDCEASDSKCYGDDPTNCRKYGRLYNWETAMKICPPGWHLPENEEWEILMDFVGGFERAGKYLKASRGWDVYKKFFGNDRYGFAALPGGFGIVSNWNNLYGEIGKSGFWWSASEIDDDYAYYRSIFYNRDGAYVDNKDSYLRTFNKSGLLSVRYVED